MKNSSHKTSCYVLQVIVEKIHTLSLQIKLVVSYVKFPLNKEKFGIARKNIPFKFYKYTEVNPDRNSQTKSRLNKLCWTAFPLTLEFSFQDYVIQFSRLDPELTLVCFTSQQI